MSVVHSAEPRERPFEAEERFHLAAKTFYEGMDSGEGDEHRITFGSWLKNEYFPAYYEGKDWDAEWMSCYDQSGVGGGMVVVTAILRNCRRPGMENAVLSLSTDLGFAIDFPREGTRNVSWTVELTGTDVRLEKVTN
ncbi:hypothetical protein EON81_20730 [bacterium]|nr:MAG: hypothetical protein EON81_20730 [bacterium]